MKTDKELLQLAARAVGDELDWIGDRYFLESDFYANIWNPLEDDGDALRLAVDLEMFVDIGDDVVMAECYLSKDTDINDTIEIFVNVDGDKHAATRRAIVRAAAAIGEGME